MNIVGQTAQALPVQSEAGKCCGRPSAANQTGASEAVSPMAGASESQGGGCPFSGMTQPNGQSYSPDQAAAIMQGIAQLLRAVSDLISQVANNNQMPNQQQGGSQLLSAPDTGQNSGQMLGSSDGQSEFANGQSNPQPGFGNPAPSDGQGQPAPSDGQGQNGGQHAGVGQQFGGGKHFGGGQHAGGGHHFGGGPKFGSGKIFQNIINRLDTALTPIVETRLPGGGAADPDRATTDADQPLRRLLPSDYADGDSAPSGQDRPGAREISNAVSADTGQTPEAGGPSDLFWIYGQFLDHDLDKTKGGDEAMPIGIPAGDPVFDPDGTGMQQLNFTRSDGVTNALGSRQQINEITALIDGSNVYGSTPEQTDSLRSHEGGRLTMGVVDADGYDELPTDASGRFYVAGDDRANENPALTSMHTVFAREHNRIADELAAQNPDWSDQQLFDEARRINVAQMQAITKNEFLPIMLGTQASSDYQGYTGVDAQISNSFATAAFRFGHSMVSNELLFIDDNGNETKTPLGEAFFNPSVVKEAGVDGILRGAAAQAAQPLDTEIVDSLRNLVITGPGAPNLDLAALNIQRGRDHGLPALNDARTALGLDPLTGFDDPRLREGAGERLAEVYDSIDDVDLWVGLLSEEPVGDGLVGETQSIILADQFNRLAAGDPNWYEHSMSAEQVAAINATTLSDIIERNSGTGDLQQYAMLTPNH